MHTLAADDLQEEWHQLKAGQHQAQTASVLAGRAAGAFMARFFQGSPVDFRCIDLLGEMAVHHHPEIARAGVHALYGTVIEGLCDDFSEAGVKICNLVLLQIIKLVRALPAGRKLAALLADQGSVEAADLLSRHQRLHSPQSLTPSRRKAIEKIILLSRVTAGADIAITSILLQGLRQELPDADLVLVGPAHLRELLGGVSGVFCRELAYRRQGTIFDRVAACTEVFNLVQAEVGARPAERYLLCDPDSRLSQLGLLPLAPEASTWYFNSRTDRERPVRAPLSCLASEWLGGLLGKRLRLRPAVFIAEDHRQAARQFVAGLRKVGANRLLVVNLGVGHAPAKRIQGAFEEKLVKELGREKQTVTLLDCGSGGEEEHRVKGLLAAVGAQGVATSFVAQEELGACEPMEQGVIGFKGSLGALAGLLSQADGFIGYDSCGQHLAAALGIPVVVVFAGAPNPRFLARWSAVGPATVVVPVKKGGSGGVDPEFQDRLIQQVFTALRRAERQFASRRRINS